MYYVILLLVVVASVKGQDKIIARPTTKYKVPTSLQDIMSQGGKCSCPKLEQIACRRGQKLDFYLSDNVCRCKLQRCLWEVCPEVIEPICGACGVKMEILDCGCKLIKCVPISQNHCPKKKNVTCGNCEEKKESKDNCGCPKDKCVPISKPQSQCERSRDCGQCKKCVTLNVKMKNSENKQSCNMKQKICERIQCPAEKKTKCDPECEDPVVLEDKCKCPRTICKKKQSAKKEPPCGECQFAKKVYNHKCGIFRYECQNKTCPMPPRGKELCYEQDIKPDKCGCRKVHSKKCELMPSGKCPPNTAPTFGSDMCLCPHQICAPCDELFKPVECGECELPVNKSVANGACRQTVCVTDPNCNMCSAMEVLNKNVKCGKCERLKKSVVQISEDKSCPVKVCQKDKRLPGCNKCNWRKERKRKCKKGQKAVIWKDWSGCKIKICIPKPKCKPCRKFKKKKCWKCMEPITRVIKGCKTSICVPKRARSCKHNKPKCSQCKQLIIKRDRCGCPIYKCVKKPCLGKHFLLSRAKCQGGKRWSRDICGCPSVNCDCVKKEKNPVKNLAKKVEDG